MVRADGCSGRNARCFDLADRRRRTRSSAPRSQLHDRAPEATQLDARLQLNAGYHSAVVASTFDQSCGHSAIFND